MDFGRVAVAVVTGIGSLNYTGTSLAPVMPDNKKGCVRQPIMI